MSCFKGDDSEPELEAEDDDEVFNTRDSGFDTMYKNNGKTSIQESESTTLHRGMDEMKTKTMQSLGSLYVGQKS